MVEISNLKKSYSNQLVINNLSYTIPNGVHGIIGKNGAGKTTLFKCIYGTERYQGTIIRSKRISYLPSEIYFYPRLRGVEFLEFVCVSKKQALNHNNLKKLNRFLNLPLEKYVRTYSTGMQKKLGLLAMFLISGDVLLLDEPFNGLDIEAQVITEELVSLMKEKHKTIIISSHITSHLTTTCDTIHFLSGGNIHKQYNRNSFNKIDSEVKEIFKITIDDFRSTFVKT